MASLGWKGLGVNASTYFGHHSPIFRRLCTVAIWCKHASVIFIKVGSVAAIIHLRAQINFSTNFPYFSARVGEI
jgi:hypothetical protein